MEYVLSLACIRSGKDAYHFLLAHLYADPSARPKSFACGLTRSLALRVTPAKRLNTQIPRMARDFACGLTPFACAQGHARKTAQHADPSHGSGFRLRALPVRCAQGYARKTAQLNKTFCFLFTEMDCLFEIIICNNLSG
jgi:hypothetical protein